jgi:hypothetical protein
MDTNFEIFKGKTFQDLCKDIITNQEHRKDQIEILISDLRSMVKGPDDVVQLVPMIKDYLNVAVSNDEHLVKLAQIIQRLITAQNNDDGNDLGLSEDEKNKLMKQAESELANITKDLLVPIKIQGME